MAAEEREDLVSKSSTSDATITFYRQKGGMIERFVKSMGAEVPTHCRKRTELAT